ncbi:MAG TPA: DUF1326 domain-containing protein [Candidatus Acidoferrales bacterium]|nr:DUF1326 domain-containing protein [Candidatus Acidoferrales bacterium]
MSGQWKLNGGYFESCNCDAACPCIFLGPPTRGECTVLVAWHIDKGNFGATRLDSLNLVLAAHSPGHMLHAKWRVALYVDERATPEQRDALTKIFAGQAGGHLANLAPCIGEVLGVKAVPIDYRAEGRRRTLSIGGIAGMDIEAVPGQNGGEVTVAGMPFCVVPGIPAVVAKSKLVTYRDYGYTWEMSDRNGFYSPFAYEG